MSNLHEAHILAWLNTHDARRHHAHVAAWVGHHARQLAKSALSRGFRPVALHEYADADGCSVFWRVRLSRNDGEKWIRPICRSEGGGFDLRQPGFPDGAPLYRLPELVARPDAHIWIVEGESCADALAALGLIATTSGGADSVGQADWRPLAGRAVTIWPDNDEPGVRYANSVSEILRASGCRVSMIDPGALGLPNKGDCVDWLAVRPSATAADVAPLPKIDTPNSANSPGAVSCLMHGSTGYAAEVHLVRGCDLKPEAVRWLWPGWLAAGKLHILGGAPGTGKTTLALGMAATVTTGGRWPCGAHAPKGNVVVWSGEDDPVDTLMPRLMLAGADVSRVYFVSDVIDVEGKRAFDPAKDMRTLANKLELIGNVRLLIVDPIVSAVAGDSHKNAEVRRALAPLVDLAGRMGCALVGVTHFSKGTAGRDPTERITGSLAFGALARVVLVAAKHQEPSDGEPRRVLLRAKSNIGPDDGGFFYDLQQNELPGHPGVVASYAVFGSAIEGAARDILAESDSAYDSGTESVSSVVQWLDDLLTDEGGKLDRRHVMTAAGAMGFKERTVHRAREKLGVVIEQTGFGKDKRSVWKKA